MATPDLVPSVSSRLVEIDATVLTEDAPANGTITFTLPWDLRIPKDRRIIQASSRTVTLSQGKGSIRLPTFDPDVVDDAGDTWVILVQKSWAPYVYPIRIPDGTGVLAFSDLAPVRELTPRETQWAVTNASVTVVDGPTGGSVVLSGGALSFRLSIPSGRDGAQGPQGIPGPGATAADDAVAGYVGARGTVSKTRSALEGTYRRSWSPAEWGAKGDGKTDDTAALRAMAAQYPTGCTIECPPGATYKVTDVVKLERAVTLAGGTWIAPTTGPMIVATASDTTLRDMTVKGPGGSPEGTNRILTIKGTAGAPLTNIRVSRVSVTDCRDNCFWLEWVRGLIVDGCTAEHFQYGGIMCISIRDFTIRDCTIRDGIMDAPIVNSYGIAVTDLSNTIAGRSLNGLIVGNTVQDNPGWEGIDTHGGKNIAIIGNTVTRCKAGIAMVTGNDRRTIAPEEMVVTGNIIDAGGLTSVMAGIRLCSNSGSPLVSGHIGTNTIIGYPTPVDVAWYDVERTSFPADQVSGWTRCSLGSGWSAYSGGGRYYNGLKVRMSSAGVQLRGMVVGGAVGSTIATLPAWLGITESRQYVVPAAGGMAVVGVLSRSATDCAIVYLSGPADPAFVEMSMTL